VNLALPALVLFLGLLPGVCCFYAYFAGRFEKRTAGVSATEELALYVVFAIPLDIVACWFYRLFGLRFEFGVATHLLAGDISDAAVHSEIASYFERFLFLDAWAYFLLLAVSFCFGSVGRRFVWASRLDVRVPYLRVRHEWFYILHGRLRTNPRGVISYVDVMTKLPDKDGSQTRLFRGVVLDFQITATGGIESITLGDPKRGKDRDKDFRWIEIPSTRLVIMGGDIHSINVTYFTVLPDPDNPPTRFDRCRIWWRSFWHEQS
jgi:hypothetical protein